MSPYLFQAYYYLLTARQCRRDGRLHAIYLALVAKRRQQHLTSEQQLEFFL